MARKKGRRRGCKRDWQQLPVKRNEVLLTLADSTALVDAVTTSPLTHDYRCTSVELTWVLEQFTAGEGPIYFGLAMGDYTLAEVEEFLEQVGLLGSATLTEREIGNRLIRRVGAWSGNEVAEVANDGKPIKTRLNWMIHDGEILQWWVYSAGGTANLTTGAVARIFGHMNGFWT